MFEGLNSAKKSCRKNKDLAAAEKSAVGCGYYSQQSMLHLYLAKKDKYSGRSCRLPAMVPRSNEDLRIERVGVAFIKKEKMSRGELRDLRGR